MIAMASPASATGALNDAHGVTVTVNGATPTVQYSDGSGNAWGGNANWFGIAWSAGQQINVQTVGSGTFLLLSTPSGKLCFGVGDQAAGTVIQLPAGFAWSTAADAAGNTTQSAIGFVGPGSSYQQTGNHMHGIQLSSVDLNGKIALVYSDGQGNQWSGNARYVVFAWA
jgi:hypothetical protein